MNHTSKCFHQIHSLFSGCGQSPGFGGLGSETCGSPETERRALVRSPKRCKSSEGTQTEEEEEGVIGKWREQERFNEDEGTVYDMAKCL